MNVNETQLSYGSHTMFVEKKNVIVVGIVIVNDVDEVAHEFSP